MAFSIEGKQVIKSLRKNKCYGVKNLLKVFPNKGWFLGHLSYTKELTVSNKSPCYERREHLLKRYPASLMNFIRFTDEKLFSVTLPTNTQMTACMLQSELWRKIFHHAVCCVPVNIQQVSLSALGHTTVHDVDPRIKSMLSITTIKCWMHDLLPEMQQFPQFICQPDQAPPHGAWETVDMLSRDARLYLS